MRYWTEKFLKTLHTPLIVRKQIITRNYRQTWRPNSKMRWVLLCIVGGVYEENNIVKNVRVDDLGSRKGDHC